MIFFIIRIVSLLVVVGETFLSGSPTPGVIIFASAAMILSMDFAAPGTGRAERAAVISYEDFTDADGDTDWIAYEIAAGEQIGSGS